MNVRQFLKLFALVMTMPFVFAACSNDDDPTPTPTPEPEPTPVPDPDYSVPADKQGLYVFNGGNQSSSIDGSLSFINFSKQAVSNNLFAAKNNRSLGGTVQNGAVYNGSLFVAVYGSRTIEVMDKLTLESIKQITIPADYDDGPRYVVADDKYVYASLYSGEVIRINPANNEIDKAVTVGPNPEEMVIVNGFLYVVNSDGLNYNNGYVNGKSVSKIDLSSFTEVKKIEVGVNPARIATDGTNVYALCNGDYYTLPSTIYKIAPDDSATDLQVEAAWLAVNDGMLYTISSVWTSDADNNWYTVDAYTQYKLSDMSVQSTAYLGENVVDAPAGIVIDAKGESLYVSSYNKVSGFASYDTAGYVNQYDLKGNLVKKYDVGVGPCFMMVLR
ncbi:MAG: hypothetical protein K5856_07635 [Bacteroidaceae bacterium]|nr:hypothetical protein [Bacteroidaceae bacterium]